MAAVILFLTTTAIAYLVDAVLIGVLLGALRARYPSKFTKKNTFLLLLASFAFLDLYWMPAAIALDIWVRIQNEAVADLLGLSGEHSVVELFGLGWLDLFVWSLQVLVAVWISNKFGGKAVRNPS